MSLIQRQRLHVSQMHSASIDPQLDQRKVFCDRKILAVAALRNQHLNRTGPIIPLPPMIQVVDKRDPIKKVIHQIKFFAFWKILIRLHQIQPDFHLLSSRSAMACADFRKIFRRDQNRSDRPCRIDNRTQEQHCNRPGSTANSSGPTRFPDKAEHP